MWITLFGLQQPYMHAILLQCTYIFILNKLNFKLNWLCIKFLLFNSKRDTSLRYLTISIKEIWWRINKLLKSNFTELFCKIFLNFKLSSSNRKKKLKRILLVWKGDCPQIYKIHTYVGKVYANCNYHWIHMYVEYMSDSELQWTN